MDLAVGSGEQLQAAVGCTRLERSGTGYYTEPFGDMPIVDGINVG